MVPECINVEQLHCIYCLIYITASKPAEQSLWRAHDLYVIPLNIIDECSIERLYLHLRPNSRTSAVFAAHSPESVSTSVLVSGFAIGTHSAA